MAMHVHSSVILFFPGCADTQRSKCILTFAAGFVADVAIVVVSCTVSDVVDEDTPPHLRNFCEIDRDGVVHPSVSAAISLKALSLLFVIVSRAPAARQYFVGSERKPVQPVNLTKGIWPALLKSSSKGKEKVSLLNRAVFRVSEQQLPFVTLVNLLAHPGLTPRKRNLNQLIRLLAKVCGFFPQSEADKRPAVPAESDASGAAIADSGAPAASASQERASAPISSVGDTSPSDSSAAAASASAATASEPKQTPSLVPRLERTTIGQLVWAIPEIEVSNTTRRRDDISKLFHEILRMFIVFSPPLPPKYYQQNHTPSLFLQMTHAVL